MGYKRVAEKKGVLEQEREPGNYYELEYFVTEGICEEEGEINGQLVFGVGIVKKINDVKIEQAVFNNFSCSREYTERIMEMLFTNSVTPVGLPYIIDDMAGI